MRIGELTRADTFLGREGESSKGKDSKGKTVAGVPGWVGSDQDTKYSKQIRDDGAVDADTVVALDNDRSLCRSCRHGLQLAAACAASRLPYSHSPVRCCLVSRLLKCSRGLESLLDVTPRLGPDLLLSCQPEALVITAGVTSAVVVCRWPASACFSPV